MRADGEASDKDDATSCSDTSTSMSVATHNGEAFSPGDVINLCDDGGEYKESLIAPSSGSDDQPITYKNAYGDTPVIDLSVDVGGATGWEDMGGGVYRKKGYGRVLWEDDVPMKIASSELCNDGDWFYPIGSMKLYYRPTSGRPADHSIRAMWFERGWTPYGIDLRNRSNITVQGITINRTGGGIGHGQDEGAPITPIRNIIIHGNTINKCMWGIWSQVFDNGVESDVRITDNHIYHCNSGISSWTNSDNTSGHTQHHARYAITGNKILNLYSISDTKVWSDVLLKSHYYTDHEGISFQDVMDSVIEGNTITTTYKKDMTSDQYWCRAIVFFLTNGDISTSGNSVLRNYISGHFYPSIYIATAKGLKGLENNIIAYNVLHYGQPDKGHMSFGLNSASDNPLRGINYFVNNTIYNAEEGLGLLISNKMNGNWIIRNNIVSSPSKVMISSDNDTGGIRLDHNIYSSSRGFQVGVNGMSFETMRKTKKYDYVGSKVANPLFVFPGNDLHLQKGSLAIDAGVFVGIQKDFDGGALFGQPDIGAYEYKPATGISPSK